MPTATSNVDTVISASTSGTLYYVINGVERAFADLKAKIAGSGKESVEAFKGVEASGKKLQTTLGGLNQQFKNVFAVSVAYQFIRAMAGLESLFGLLIKQGITYNNELELGRVTLASTLTATRQLIDSTGQVATTVQQYQVNLARAHTIQRELVHASIRTLGSYKDLEEVYRIVLAFSAEQNATDKERLQLAENILNASRLFGQTQDMTIQEVRQMLTLETNRGQAILQSLGYTVDELRELKKKGELVKELNRLLEAYSAIAKELQGSFTGLTSTAESFINIITARAFSSVFANLKSFLTSYNTELETMLDTTEQRILKISPERMASHGKSLARESVEILEGISDIIAGTAEFLDRHETTIKHLGEIFSVVKKGIIGVVVIVETVIFSVNLLYKALKSVVGVVESLLGVSDNITRTSWMAIREFALNAVRGETFSDYVATLWKGVEKEFGTIPKKIEDVNKESQKVFVRHIEIVRNFSNNAGKSYQDAANTIQQAIIAAYPKEVQASWSKRMLSRMFDVSVKDIDEITNKILEVFRSYSWDRFVKNLMSIVIGAIAGAIGGTAFSFLGGPLKGLIIGAVLGLVNAIRNEFMDAGTRLEEKDPAKLEIAKGFEEKLKEISQWIADTRATLEKGDIVKGFFDINEAYLKALSDIEGSMANVPPSKSKEITSTVAKLRKELGDVAALFEVVRKKVEDHTKEMERMNAVYMKFAEEAARAASKSILDISEILRDPTLFQQAMERQLAVSRDRDLENTKGNIKAQTEIWKRYHAERLSLSFDIMKKEILFSDQVLSKTRERIKTTKDAHATFHEIEKMQLDLREETLQQELGFANSLVRRIQLTEELTALEKEKVALNAKAIKDELAYNEQLQKALEDRINTYKERIATLGPIELLDSGELAKFTILSEYIENLGHDWQELENRNKILNQQLAQIPAHLDILNRKGIESARNLKTVSVNIASFISGVMTNMLQGFAQGTLKVKDALRAFKDAFIGTFIKVFVDAYAAKLEFDVKFEKNLDGLSKLLERFGLDATQVFEFLFKIIGSKMPENLREGAKDSLKTSGEKIADDLTSSVGKPVQDAAAKMGNNAAAEFAKEFIKKLSAGIAGFSTAEFIKDFIGAGIFKSKQSSKGGKMGGLIGGLIGAFTPVGSFLGSFIGNFLGSLFGGLFAHVPTKGTIIRRGMKKFLKEIGATFADEIDSSRYFFKETKSLAKFLFGDDDGDSFLKASKIILERKVGPGLKKQLMALGAFLTSESAISQGKSVEQTGTTFGNMLVANLGVDRIPEAIDEIIRKAGISFDPLVQHLTDLFTSNKISLDFYKEAIEGAVEIFYGQFPEALRLSEIALESFSENGVFDLERFKEKTEEVISLFNDLVSTIPDLILESLSISDEEFEKRLRKMFNQVTLKRIISEFFNEEFFDALFQGINLKDGLNSEEIGILSTRLKAARKDFYDLLETAGLLPDVLEDSTSSADDLVDKIKELAREIRDLQIERLNLRFDFLSNLNVLGLISDLELVEKKIALTLSALKGFNIDFSADSPFVNLDTHQINQVISFLKNLAALEIERYQAQVAAIQDALNREIDAIREAFDARREALQKEKEEVKKLYESHLDSLKKSLAIAEDYKRVAESIQDIIDSYVFKEGSIFNVNEQFSILTREFVNLQRALATSPEEKKPEIFKSLSENIKKQLELLDPVRDREKILELLRMLDAYQSVAEKEGSKVESILEEIQKTEAEMEAVLRSIDQQIADLDKQEELAIQRAQELAQAQIDALKGPVVDRLKEIYAAIDKAYLEQINRLEKQHTTLKEQLISLVGVERATELLGLDSNASIILLTDMSVALRDIRDDISELLLNITQNNGIGAQKLEYQTSQTGGMSNQSAETREIAVTVSMQPTVIIHSTGSSGDTQGMYTAWKRSFLDDRDLFSRISKKIKEELK